jgi:hypothetical protein
MQGGASPAPLILGVIEPARPNGSWLAMASSGSRASGFLDYPPVRARAMPLGPGAWSGTEFTAWVLAPNAR